MTDFDFHSLARKGVGENPPSDTANLRRSLNPKKGGFDFLRAKLEINFPNEKLL